MIAHHDLTQRRQQIEKLRQMSSLSEQHAKQIEQSILSSWQRSHHANIPAQRSTAPLVSSSSSPSVLHHALSSCQDELSHIALQSSMAMAVADMNTTIIWSKASQHMQAEAEKVHFIAGGQWSEEYVGTNALALSLKTGQSSSVFSNEHFMPSLENWVCYATPIIDPFTQQAIGVIDLSTTWHHHHAFGILAVERCAQLLQNAVLELQKQRLFIQAFSSPKVFFKGKCLPVTPRQIEILSILALCPQGMNLDALHQAVYGERAVRLGTLKAEISQLRELLGGLLGSRPYRLLIDVDGDFLQAERALNAGQIESALQLYTGVFLVKTESPFLCTWRDCLESRLSQAIFSTQQTDVLFKYVARFPEAVDAVERLIELMPERKHLFKHLGT